MSRQNSIVCPKCDRESFDENDIKWKFCSQCGYHDAVDGPPGIPGVSPKFRQPTPAMQIKAEISSLEGSFHNWQSQVTSTDAFVQRLQRTMNDLMEIAKLMEQSGKHDEW